MKAILSFYTDILALFYCGNKALLRLCVIIKKTLRKEYKRARAIEIAVKYNLYEKK